ncbi:Phenylalanine--tRNA ligase alpha subunit A [Armadillidium nasatum]|uniref:phenylalanine--tRNA ligase n=1 Tax=Armadillidium nasatum TaxID=96803 RepID=A0A5N5SUQ6_9CRUS|nr:Phenylalanine--tRNA ligase alpha subunit A [Armadillidium nasatum]
MDTNIQEQILNLLKDKDELLSTEAANLLGEPHQKIVGVIKSLESFGKIIEVSQQSQKIWVCSEEGEKLAEDGSHEARLFHFISEEGVTVDKIKSDFPSSGVALGAALKNKWVRKEGNTILKNIDSIVDLVQANLIKIKSGDFLAVDDKIKSDYKKRKLIKENDVISFVIKKGSAFSTMVTKQEAELTKEMIESGDWKQKSFKPFNFKSKGKLELRSGHLHPLMQLRGEFRKIFLEMGFSEMPTNNYIESAFWNFDALFQPQQHPARDAQDTFYISDPEKTLSVPLDYLEKVKSVHSEGGFGSVGYRSPWSFEESQKNLLRTHTTAVSARLLYKLALDGFRPAKYFSIDKVYRNETLDATHLAEFHQVEGVIADRNLSMKHLMGVFSAFFKKIGIPSIRFKPTYNPYTEPSMEIYSFHEGLAKWVEIGNSGYFRPEMLRPMGLPEDVTVAGWGLSLERPAMIMFGINNIRELVGPRVKMELVLENPLCKIEKNV